MVFVLYEKLGPDAPGKQRPVDLRSRRQNRADGFMRFVKIVSVEQSRPPSGLRSISPMRTFRYRQFSRAAMRFFLSGQSRNTGGTVLPGLRMFFGSKAFFRARIASSSSWDL
ncbi:MAG: hypothetical protein RL274_2327 [Pseudomonadota bacterium]